VFTECAGGAHLVEAHEPRVARHVSRDYGGEPASDTTWLLLLHEAKHTPSRDIMYDGRTQRQGLLVPRVEKHHPSGTPANRMPSMDRSRPARKAKLSLHALEASR
jgi:hypothetical protein